MTKVVDEKVQKSIKNINIDINNYANNFNYVWIPTLKRYYYVDSLELISADFSRLHLKEDVLTLKDTAVEEGSVYYTDNEGNKY